MNDETPRVNSKSPDGWLAEVNRYERQGEAFRAYDIAMQGLIEHPDALALKHRAVLCLADMGATRQAAAKFAALGLGGAAATASGQRLRMDIASLRARLSKDDALGSIKRSTSRKLPPATPKPTTPGSTLRASSCWPATATRRRCSPTRSSGN